MNTDEVEYEEDEDIYEEVNSAQCNRCGSEMVVWQQTKRGGWCLFDVHSLDNIVSSIPHFMTCQGIWPENYEMEDE